MGRARDATFADLESLSPLARALAGPRRGGRWSWIVFFAAFAIESAFMIALGLVDQTRHILGIPGSVMALTAVMAGALAGPAVGAGVAIAGGAVYYVTVASSGARGDTLASIVSVALWVSTGIVSGLLADALREQAEKRREAAADLAATDAARRTQDEVALLHASLEAALLPPEPLTHPSLHILSIYRPSEARLQLGGDFYDVLRLPDDTLALIVGDVAGHGPQAAALGARLRAGWRALRLAETPVDQILRSLDTMVAENDPAGEMFATVCLARIDHTVAQAQVVCCGHAPPILVSKGDVSMLDVSPGPALGPFGADGHRPTTIDLPEGWVLFVYTDGLTEARLSPGETERLGEEGLMRRLSDDPTYLADADGLARLIDEVEQANGEPLADDVAVVAVRSRA